MNTTALIIICSLIMAAIVAIAETYFLRKRHSEKLRTRFGDAESRQEGVGSRHAEAGLDKRTVRVESLRLQPLGAGDCAHFLESWSRVQTRFVDGPESAVTEADQLLGEVMSTRGYQVSDLEHRAADFSIDYPAVLENYRSAHAIAVRQTHGQASTEELRQAIIHYRTLFDALVGVPEMARAKAAS